MKTPELEDVQKLAYVKCGICKKTHQLHSEKYLTLVGNLLVGTGGGVFGHGDWEKHGIPVMHFCPKCLTDYLKGLGL
ncbi:hypothetical protein MOC12_20835 [Bacillus spizizenii]|nr:hypothetical protein [Bacillus spizizenii]